MRERERYGDKQIKQNIEDSWVEGKPQGGKTMKDMKTRDNISYSGELGMERGKEAEGERKK